MATTSIRFSMTVLGSAVLAATLAQSADLQPALVSSLNGTLRVEQGVPCGSNVDLTTPVTGGFLELSPAEGMLLAGGNRLWTLTRGAVTFAGFSVTRSCLGFSETRTYGTIHVQISHAVSFTATPTATPNMYNVVIPKANFQVSYITEVNGGLETGTKIPKEDVTGSVNLTTGTVQMHVVLGTEVTFQAGCVFGACIIDETKSGTLTANITGTMIFPDSDGDGVPDRSDNCRYTPNPDQSAVSTPTIVPPPNVTLASCLSREFGRATGSDICDGKPVSITNDAPLQFTVGLTTIHWQATDWMNRVASANQTVTVIDKTPPAFTSVPPDLSLNDCISPNLGTPTATDDCAGTVTFSNNAPPIFYVGVTPVTWTATDVSGNQKTAIQTVTVVDTTPPTVTCVPTNPPGSSFRVHAEDHCLGTPVIRLGTYLLNNDEVVMINETGRPGIRLLESLAGGVRHFQVGRGEAIISATDASNNVATVRCPVPR